MQIHLLLKKSRIQNIRVMCFSYFKYILDLYGFLCDNDLILLFCISNNFLFAFIVFVESVKFKQALWISFYFLSEHLKTVLSSIFWTLLMNSKVAVIWSVHFCNWTIDFNRYIETTGGKPVLFTVRSDQTWAPTLILV